MSLVKYSPIIPVKAILYPSKQPSFPWGGTDERVTSFWMIGTLTTGWGVFFFFGDVFLDLTNTSSLSSSISSSSSLSSSVLSSSFFNLAIFFGCWISFSDFMILLLGVSPKNDPTPPLI